MVMAPNQASTCMPVSQLLFDKGSHIHAWNDVLTDKMLPLICLPAPDQRLDGPGMALSGSN